MSDTDELRRAGRHAEAAQRLRERGELAAAAAMLESIWDYAGAADIARQRGDVVEELRLRLEADEHPRAMQLVDLLPQLTPVEQERATPILVKWQLFVEAATLAEARGALVEAERLYHLAQRPIEEALVATRRGDLRRAGALLESALTLGTAAEQVRARIELATIHTQLGRRWEAIAILQKANTTSVDERQRILRQLTVAFFDLGLEFAARASFARLRPAERHNVEGEGGKLRPAERLATFEDLLEEERALASTRARQPELVAGRYRVLRYLGAGATGRAYLAHDELADRHVALKLVPPPVDPRLAEGFRQFLQEVKVLYHLHHPNVVAVQGIDEKNGVLVLEYLDGGSLADRAHGGALPEPMVRRAIVDLLNALTAIHAQGVVHRDVKPSNMLIAPSGAIKLGDFGAAHLRGAGATQTAAFVGTLGYMSPEQIRGETPSFAVDLYGAGCTAYHLLTGRLPFTGPDFAAQHLGDPPPRPSEIDAALAPWDAIITIAMAKRASDRYASASEMLDAIVALPAIVSEHAAAPIETSPATGARVAERWQRLEVQIVGATELWRVLDRTLGRELEVERFIELDAAEQARHIEWLRLVAEAGPLVQRVVRLDPEGPVFEALSGVADNSVMLTLTDEERSELRDSLARLWNAGRVHGALLSSLLRTPTGVVLRLAAAPGEGITVEEERALLY